MTYNISNKAKEVDRQPMTFMERMYLPAIAKGLKITLGHMFIKRPTINYPEVKRPFSSTFRGLHVLNRDEEGRERCTACGLCALSCPAEAITMESAERLPSESNLYREEKYAANYEINIPKIKLQPESSAELIVAASFTKSRHISTTTVR